MRCLIHFSSGECHKNPEAWRRRADNFTQLSVQRALPFHLSKYSMTPHKLLTWGIYLVVVCSGSVLSKASGINAPNPPKVDLGYSRYRGVRLPGGVDQFLGMRYAQAPVDDLRFRAPQEPEDHYEEQDASQVSFVPKGLFLPILQTQLSRQPNF